MSKRDERGREENEIKRRRERTLGEGRNTLEKWGRGTRANQGQVQKGKTSNYKIT